MVIVMGEFRLPPQQLAAARPMMRKVVDATRAEAGCIAYAYAEDMLDPGLIRVSETWRDRAALKAHFTAEEQVKLTLLIVTINGWNRLAVGFRSVHPAAAGDAG